MPRAKTNAMESDRRILLIVVFLMAIGASLVASSSSYFSASKFDDSYLLLRRHLVRIVIAGLFLVLAMHIDYRIFRRLSVGAFAIGVALLFGLFVFGYAIRDTVRWYNVRLLQVTVQPSELARLAMVLFFAYWIARKGKDIRHFKSGFLPLAIAVVVVVGLMAAQPNYGTALATMLIAFVMLFAGGARFSHLLLLGLATAGTAAMRVISVPYVRERLAAHMDQASGATAINWQPHQSLVALGTGGLFGNGFGGSRQKLAWLPDSHTDFIFSILGEEAGLAGTLLVSLLFLLLALRALKISQQSSDRFGEMVVIGLGSSVFVYAVLNMCVATALFPVTGLPLPFLSYGGSALVVNAVSIGILLNVSKKRGSKVQAQLRRRMAQV